LGYDSVWAYDHLAPYWTKRGQAYECWTLLAAIAQRTENIKLGSLVTNVNLRNPALLAKITSTLDNLSKGRLILGLGTGDRMSRDELLSYGFDFGSVDERLERLRETIVILKAMWTKDEISFEGKYTRLSHAVNFPKPMQKPHPPIWIGGKHPRILDVVAEMADGWNYWEIENGKLERRTRHLREQCIRIGRDPEQIVKSWAGRPFKRPESGKSTNSVKDMQGHLRSLTDNETTYFIASFGSRTKSSNLAAFAEAVKSLN
jgi:alkanesulfonate monooxygenase SsuD/methylene tetrahydromethanopterin reductase-like flavin-dependent oxidoreductase (luciferase family)